MISAPRGISLLCFVGLLGVLASPAQESFGPSDPIASVDGDPIYLGQLNLLLIDKLRAKDLDAVDLSVQQASSGLLVKQHLALRSLKQQGGDALKRVLDRSWTDFVGQLSRQGVRLDDYAKRRKCDERSLRASRDWEAAWASYLKSRMTDENLRRFYQANREKYAGSRYRLSHIFLPVDKSEPDAEAIAGQRMSEIHTGLKATSDYDALAAEFARLAKSESDGATAADGGRLGWVSQPGDLPREVMAALRSTAVETVSEPIRSNRGLHLVLVHEKQLQEGGFDQVTDQGPIRRDAATSLFRELISRQQDAKVVWLIRQLQPPTN